jgi:DNA replication initiation complex subunit (GINS family)
MVEEPTGGTAMAEKGDASQDEVKELTDQFYVTLRAYVARLDKEDETRSPKSF